MVRVLLALALAATSTAQVILHVHPDRGSDANAGTLRSPLQTVAAARDALRSQRPLRDGARVVLHEGYHAPFALDAAFDSGLPGAPINYTAASGERNPPVVSGGRRVPAAAFSPAAGKPGIYEADLTKLGLTAADFGALPAVGDTIHLCDQLKYKKMQLFQPGVRTYLARYPNLLPNGHWQFMHALNGGATGFSMAKTNPDAAKVAGWAKEEAPWAHGYWDWDWADGLLQIKGISAGGLNVSTAGPAGVGKHNARWVGVNILSEIDAAGEFFISKKGLLSYMPAAAPSTWTQQTMPVVSVNSTCIDVTGTSHVNLQGLTISHCKAVGVEAGNTLEQPGGGPAQGPGLVHNVHVDGCTISGIGGTGIDIRGVGSGVKNSVIHDIGCRGAVVHGGNATQLLAGNMFATNNSIKDFAQYKRTYMSGIHWAGVNNTYSHNTITDAPHNCMLGGGNEGDGVDCVFEFMRFERCGYESADTGAFYTCGQQASAFVNRGNILRHSTWNDIRNTAGTGVQGNSLQAVYLDDQMSGWHIYNNSFYNCSTGTFIGGGSYNLIHDNYYELVDTAQHFDARGTGWQKGACNFSAPCVTTGNGGKCTCDPGAAYHVLHGPAGAEYSQKFGKELNAVLTDPKCVNKKQGSLPCYSQVVDNNYCNVGKFIDAPLLKTLSWNAVVKNNKKVACRGPPK